MMWRLREGRDAWWTLGEIGRSGGMLWGEQREMALQADSEAGELSTLQTVVMMRE